MAQLVKNPPAMQRRPGFNPWVGQIPWRKERLPTPVFWPEEFHGLYSPWGQKESDTTERLSLTHQFTDAHLDCFHLPAITNQAVMNSYVQCFCVNIALMSLW